MASDRYERMMTRLRAGAQVMIDGGTGSETERRGIPTLPNAWSGGGALSHPEIVQAIHADYIAHGAQVVISNTFGTGRNVLEDAGQAHLFDQYNGQAVALALAARTAAGADDVLVAGGMSHWSFSGRLPDLEEVREGAAAQAQIMRDAGADLLMLEMMIEIPRMLAMLDGAQASGLPVWVGLSCAPNPDGTMGLQAFDTDPEGMVQSQGAETLAEAIAALKGRDIPLLSIMHTDVAHIPACLDVVEAHWDGLTGVYAHSGAFVGENWVFDNTISPGDYATAATGWKARGINVIGGCCGIRPDHMEAVRVAAFDGAP